MCDMERAALELLGQNRKYLTRQQMKTLRGQVLAGDVEGAVKGFNKLNLRRK